MGFGSRGRRPTCPAGFRHEVLAQIRGYGGLSAGLAVVGPLGGATVRGMTREERFQSR